MGAGTTVTIYSLAAGTYTFMVTNSSGCTSAASQEVVINPQPDIPQAPVELVNCASGAGHASITISTPLGAGLQYSLDGGSFQSEIVFNEVKNGSHYITVLNESGCINTGNSFTVTCDCPNGPALSLSSKSGNACGTSPFIISGNTFTNAGKVTITETGAGSVSQPEVVSSPFSFTYTPDAADLGKTILIYFTTDNPSGAPCAVATAIYSLTINDIPSKPSVSSINPLTFCDGGSVALTSSPGTRFLWSTGAATSVINVTTSGDYSVQVINEAGCLSLPSNPVKVIVKAAPPTPSVTAGGPLSFCTGSNVTLTSSTGTTYLWSNGSNTPEITVTTSGSYFVSVTNTDGCQSATSTPTTVNVNPLPSKPVITATGPLTFCAGQSVTLTSGTGTGYLWSNGATTESINVTEPGIYTVRVTSLSGCQSDPSEPVDVTVYPADSKPLVSPGGPLSLCQEVSVTLTSGPGSGYLWSTGETTQSITVTKAASYSVQTINSLGCKSEVSDPVTVNVTSTVIPKFEAIGLLCPGSVPPSLPGTSTNSVTGSWNPAEINTSLPGTTIYTFTPFTGQCASVVTMEIKVTDLSAPLHSLDCTPGAGKATITVTSPTGEGFQYRLDNGIWQNFLTFANVAEGNHTISVLTPEGCTNTGESFLVSCASNSSLTVTKSVTDPTPVTLAGQVINYLIVITNTGTTEITSVAASELYPGSGPGTLSTPTESLTPDKILNVGETWTFTASYVATQTDLDTKTSLVNTIRIVTAEVPGPITASATTKVEPSALIAVDMNRIGMGPITSAGQAINYQITIPNKGKRSITGIVPTELYPGAGAGSLSSATESIVPNGILDVGETWNYTASYTTIQQDIDTKTNLVNTISVVTKEVPGPTIASVSTPVSATSSLTVTKSTTASGFSYEGEKINYSIKIANSGDKTLSNIQLADPTTTVNCSGIPNQLAPGSEFTCSSIHTVTLVDILKGSISNTATATGNDPSFETVTGTSNTVTINLDNLPPAITCQTSVNVNTDAGRCDALIANGITPDYSDPNNNIVSFTWTMTGATTAKSPASGINKLNNFVFNKGTTIIEYTVTDDPGLAASCSLSVTVTDAEAPSIACQASQIRYMDIEGSIYTVKGNEFDPASISDNCQLASVINDYNGLPSLNGAKFPAGVTIVKWTATDSNHNSSVCSMDVKITDNEKPVAICKNITVVLDLNTGLAKISPSDIDGGSFDNTGTISLSSSRTDFSCADVGVNNVILKVTDEYGNFETCTANVTVKYAIDPKPVVSPLTDVICNGEKTSFAMSNNIPKTIWTWTVDALPKITGATGDNNGLSSSINQNLFNSDTVLQNVIYNITPQIYGCALAPVSATVYVNPVPQIRVRAADNIVCNGGTTEISIKNPNLTIRGRWSYDLTVMTDSGITGTTANGTYSGETVIADKLTNTDGLTHKIIYRFIPRIIPDDGGTECSRGPEKTVIIMLYPYNAQKYEIIPSNYNGVNVSCFGRSDGSLNVVLPGDPGDASISWSGPNDFKATTATITDLVAGQYNLVVVDKNMCTARQTFDLIQPGKLSILFEPSLSISGGYNINCYDEKTGSITATAINSVGNVNYLWSDGSLASIRTDLGAGTYQLAITDGNNCAAAASQQLTAPQAIKVLSEIIRPFCGEKPDGTINIKPEGGDDSGVYYYKWFDNSTENYITNLVPGIYNVEVTDRNRCSVKESIEIKPERDYCIIMPEAFSPNEDGINDDWEIINIDLYPNSDVTIYNRWGQSVWRSEKGYKTRWTGNNSNGKELPLDSYHYVIDLHNGSRVLIGTVTIIR